MTGLVPAILILAASAGFAQHEPSADRLNEEFLASFGRDFAAVVTSPLHWGSRDLGRFALISAATLGLSAADEDIRDWAQERRTGGSADISAVFEKAGNGAYLLGLAAALYAAGEVGDSRGLRRTGLLSIESLATASAIGAVMKVAIGRARPYAGQGSTSFHPFSSESAYHAFPSGHAAAAFAVATTIARQSRGVAVDILAYGAAALVACPGSTTTSTGPPRCSPAPPWDILSPARSATGTARPPPPGGSSWGSSSDQAGRP